MKGILSFLVFVIILYLGITIGDRYQIIPGVSREAYSPHTVTVVGHLSTALNKDYLEVKPDGHPASILVITTHPYQAGDRVLMQLLRYDVINFLGVSMTVYKEAPDA